VVGAAVDRRVRCRAQLLDLGWSQVDLGKKTIRVGNSKTDACAGRLVPLNARAATAIAFWVEIFPNRKSDYAVFPTERVGAGAEGSAATSLITPSGELFPC
jgi:integrase